MYVVVIHYKSPEFSVETVGLFNYEQEAQLFRPLVDPSMYEKLSIHRLWRPTFCRILCTKCNKVHSGVEPCSP